MIRVAIIGAILLCAGVAIGWVAAPAVYDSAPPFIDSPTPAPVVAPGDELQRLEAERDRLEAENDELVAQVTQLLDQQSQWLAAAGLPDDAGSSATLAPSDNGDGDRRRREDDSEESRARREAFMRENERRMQEFEDRIAAQITDPAGIEAYNSLMEWREYQDDLRREFRNAETDEERDRIRAKMDEARGTARQMVETQQDAMLRSIAAANGVSDSAKQAEFVAAMRATLESPFFELEGMFVGGGGPGRGGSPFGGGRGGRPSGQFQSRDGN